MRSRRELILGSLAVLLGATRMGAGDSGKRSPLEVTYYYLPG